MHTLFSWKSVPKFSRLVVWCAHDFSSENVTILALRLPTTVKNRILYGSSELFGEIISHPILAHLLMIQGLDFNHSMSTKYLGQALLREVSPATELCILQLHFPYAFTEKLA